jgi:hypothetical protein
VRARAEHFSGLAAFAQTREGTPAQLDAILRHLPVACRRKFRVSGAAGAIREAEATKIVSKSFSPSLWVETSIPKEFETWPPAPTIDGFHTGPAPTLHLRSRKPTMAPSSSRQIRAVQQRDAENGILRFVWNRIRPICLEHWFGPHCLLKLHVASRSFNALSCPNYSDTSFVCDEGERKNGLRTKVSDQLSRQSQFLTTTCLLRSSLWVGGPLEGTPR